MVDFDSHEFITTGHMTFFLSFLFFFTYKASFTMRVQILGFCTLSIYPGNILN